MNLFVPKKNILAALLNKPLYGLEISKATNISVWRLYSTLRSMEHSGLIESYWDDSSEAIAERGGARRRYYQLTQSGIEHLTREQKPSASLILRVRKLLWLD